MFTLDQIHQAFGKVKGGADFPKLVQDLKNIGVIYYENVVTDGQTTYFGTNNFSLQDKSKYPIITVNDLSSSEALKQALKIHQDGKTDYLTFCKEAAAAGVDKWVTHMIDMSVCYYDKPGNLLVEEKIPLP
ncbi:DUF1398 domain-containing protein [Mangrovimonas aestuarii]|uniref:DUF1398 domain-containing protein n=1 Tax=Mangrovimonas aestuarii TaxID=3018443 RepID=UPI002377E2D9|nr:DUF1398 family protein [Mangrovimonas aestuarii]